MPHLKNAKDLFAGALFVAIAVTFFFAANILPFGNAGKMGPGYFPLVLSVLLGGAGVIIFARGLIESEEAPAPFALRGVFFVVLGVLIFGALVRSAGFAPAITLSVFVTTFASRESRLLPSCIIALSMLLGASLIFIVGLRLPWPLLGPWFGF